MAASNPAPSRRPARKRPSRGARVLGGLAWTLVLGGSLLVGTTVGWLGQAKSLSTGNILEIAKNANRDPQDVFKDDALTVLILGCDEDLTVGGKQVTDHAARSDMMLVARLDFKNKRITGLSVPRDTRCDLPPYGVHKMNAYHKIAPLGEGPDLARRATEYLLASRSGEPRVRIDKVMVVDYDAFVSFVDLLGGVNVDVDRDLKYTDRAGGLYVDLEKGPQRLDGYQAMGFVRIRKNAGDDYARQERQKRLLVAVKEQVAKRWTALPQIVDAGTKVMGDAFSLPEIVALANFARSVPKTSIKMGAVPTVPGRGTFLVVDRKKLAPMLEEYDMMDSPGDSAVAQR